MRYLLLVIFLMAAVQLPAIEPEQLTELIAIFQEYEIATEELTQGYKIVQKGLGEVKAGQAKSEQGLIDSNERTNDLEASFITYKTDTDKTIRKLRIGIFAIGAACILSIFCAILT